METFDCAKCKGEIHFVDDLFGHLRDVIICSSCGQKHELQYDEINDMEDDTDVFGWFELHPIGDK